MTEEFAERIFDCARLPVAKEPGNTYAHWREIEKS